MICLEVYVNDKKVAVVGKKTAQHYSASVTYSKGNGEIEVAAGGATEMDEDNMTETFLWGSQFIQVGDIVKVSVIDSEKADDPIESDKRNHSEEIENLEKKIIEATARHRVKVEKGASDNSKKNADNPACSFCRKDKNAVERLIDGPSVRICNECVGLCNEILEEVSAQESTPKWPKRD